MQALHLGSVEPHRALLTQPDPGLLFYKILSAENFVRCVEGKYLHFNRVDSYKDFPTADAHDGAELPLDQAQTSGIGFTKAPEFKVSDYYAQSRSRTYACCLSAENSPFIWQEYGGGGDHGKVGLVFDFDLLRNMLNRNVQNAIDNDLLIYNDQNCHQIFSINFGLVDYVDRATTRIGNERLPNPIQYTYIKDLAFAAERELRISMSALGMGNFALKDGSFIEFGLALPVYFDFREAIEGGAIRHLEVSPQTDLDWIEPQVEAHGVKTCSF